MLYSAGLPGKNGFFMTQNILVLKSNYLIPLGVEPAYGLGGFFLLVE